MRSATQHVREDWNGGGAENWQVQKGGGNGGRLNRKLVRKRDKKGRGGIQNIFNLFSHPDVSIESFLFLLYTLKGVSKKGRGAGKEPVYPGGEAQLMEKVLPIIFSAISLHGKESRPNTYLRSRALGKSKMRRKFKKKILTLNSLWKAISAVLPGQPSSVGTK